MALTQDDDDAEDSNGNAKLPKIVSSWRPMTISESTKNKNKNEEAEVDTESQVHRKSSNAVKDAMTKMHWVLHFDINETILVGDDVGGDTTSDCYNKIIAKSAFCQMPGQKRRRDKQTQTQCSESENNNNNDGTGTGNGCNHVDYNDDKVEYDYDNTSVLAPTHWWDGSPMNGEESADRTTEDVSSVPPLYTGWDWPPGCCPYYRTSYKRLSKTFVDHPHGAIYKPIHNKIIHQMTASSDLPLEFHHILPAFFHTVYTLVKQQQQQQQQQHDRPPVTIVFRTFGTDLPYIARAMTAFARGKHPHYPDFIHPEYELDDESCCLYNAKWKSQGSCREEGCLQGEEYFQYQLYRYHDQSLAAAGDQQVLDLLHGGDTLMTTTTTTTTTGHYVYGIRDDYQMWKRHNWEPWAGKPVWVTAADQPSHTTKPNQSYRHHHHHILLDDNIHNLPHDGIASVRRRRGEGKTSDSDDSPTSTCTATTTTTTTSRSDLFESLSGSEIQSMQGIHLIRVPTIEPILNVNWFVEQIQKVQSAVLLSK